ncbi:IS110 family transposase [Mucilaginibacter terrigena]|uniref:IS110 family transposase n=1 Tax=Mucilaginibacter terrigena TaxID=2492395 RepID=A0A4Q5LP36_9SPHI|nr:IS110 family transposase [Mucilaginibacter terrigena]RYU91145.1 IS110 family transposase [Mucilaginibacter terrigena]
MQTQTNYTGIDISKSFFDVAFLQAGRYTYYKFSNDRDGFKALLKVVPSGTWVVMEASGPYYLQLACFLHDQRIAVSVINPLVIRRFSQMRMSRAKTDKKDAKMIAEYGKTEQPPLWQKPEQHVITLQQMEALLARLQTEYTSLSNQLGSFDSSGMLTGQLRKQVVAELKHKQTLVKKLTNQMEQIAKHHYSNMLADLESIPGLGKKTAMILTVLSGGFSRFDDYRKLSSYIGICPRIFESGTSVKGKARICKMGMSRIRATLYVCSWSASRCNKACRELYERLLAKGKAKKLALIAVANKLLKQAFAIARQQTKYQENYSNITCF